MSMLNYNNLLNCLYDEVMPIDSDHPLNFCIPLEF